MERTNGSSHGSFISFAPYVCHGQCFEQVFPARIYSVSLPSINVMAWIHFMDIHHGSQLVFYMSLWVRFKLWYECYFAVCLFLVTVMKQPRTPLAWDSETLPLIFYIYGIVVRNILRFFHQRKIIFPHGNFFFREWINLHIFWTILLCMNCLLYRDNNCMIKRRYNTSFLILHIVKHTMESYRLFSGKC